VDVIHADLSKFRSSTDGPLVTIIQAIKELSVAVVPIISSQNISRQPSPPDDLKYTCLATPNELQDKPDYPILRLGQCTYWGKNTVIFYGFPDVKLLSWAISAQLR
jgi:hypothetical protein